MLQNLFRRLFPRKAQSASSMSQEPAPIPPSPRTLENIADFIDEDGRRHRGDAPYLLPKDDQEINRLNFQHYILRYVLKGNCYAPVDELLQRPCRVLDVGCGSSRWGQEIAATYPTAQVIGIDLEEAIRTASTPLNYQFEQANILQGLPFAAQSFHYVHQRLLVAGIPYTQWPQVVQELKRITVPGGWVELVEMGTTFHNAGPATRQFLGWFQQISALRGIDASRMSEIGNFLQQAGLSEIRQEAKPIAVGQWGGKVGQLLAQDILTGWPSMRPAAHQILNVAPETFDAVIGQLDNEWNSRHTTYEVYFACGRA